MRSSSSTVNDLFRGDLVQVTPALPNPLHGRKWTTAYVSTLSKPDSPVELCDNPYRRSMWWCTLPENVRIIRRGNWFKYRFGMPLSFMSILDEAGFWKDQGKMHDLRNPHNEEYYSWTYQQALVALENGTADAFFYSSGVPGLPAEEAFFGGYIFDDREVAERMRRHSLNDLAHLLVS